MKVSGFAADIAGKVYEFTGISPDAQSKLVATLVVLLVYLALRAVGSWVLHRKVKDVTRRYVAAKTLTTVLGIFFILIALKIWLGNIRGFAAYLGILSAGLAIALQDPLTNLAGWIFITARKPFVVGDRVEIGGHRGDVIDLRLFQFSLVEIGNWVDADQSSGRIIHIPNGWIFKHAQANYTQGFNFVWNEVPITLTFESDWKSAKELLTEIATKHSAVKSEYAAEQIRRAAKKYLIFFEYLTPIVWTSVADVGVTLTVRYLCESRKRRSSAAAIWEEVLEAFAERDNIDFAYPTTRFYDNAMEGKPGARAEVDGDK